MVAQTETDFASALAFRPVAGGRPLRGAHLLLMRDETTLEAGDTEATSEPWGALLALLSHSQAWLTGGAGPGGGEPSLDQDATAADGCTSRATWDALRAAAQWLGGPRLSARLPSEATSVGARSWSELLMVFGLWHVSRWLPGCTVGSPLDSADREVLALLAAADEYDEDFLRPSAYAVSATLDLLHRARQATGRPLPRVSVSTLGDGGVRVHFHHPDKRMRLCVPPDPQRRAYVYHCVGENYGSEDCVSGACLARWLDWLDD